MQYGTAPRMCRTTGTGRSKNRWLSAVTSAPLPSSARRAAPATDGTRASGTRPGGTSQVREAMDRSSRRIGVRLIAIGAGAVPYRGRRRESYLWPGQAPVLVRPHRDLHPVPRAELGHEAGDVRLHGAEADVQLLGDLT